MKHTLFILALITATIQTFAQSPRIKLNQITKDSVTGSVLISSPTDSGMVYSRDLFISYGADTVLILGGDTLAATSSIISSVLSDGVTITGDGTTGSELTVDTATVIATKGDLDLYYLDSNPDGYTSNTGTVTSVGGTGTVNGISLSGTVTSSGNLTLGGTLSGVDLASQVTGTLPIANGGTGATTFTSGRVLFGNGTSAINTDAGLFWDNSNKRLDINTSSISSGTQSLNVYSFDGSANFFTTRGEDPFNNTISLYNNPSSGQGYGTGIYFRAKSDDTNSRLQAAIYSSWTTATDASRTAKLVFRTTENGAMADKLTILGNGNLGIGTSSPSEKLDVDGNARFRSIGSGASAGALHYTSTGVLTTNTSDVRLKTNLQPLENTLNKLLDINTYTFNWINETDRVDLGMVAQEVEEIFPRLVFTNPVDGYKGIHYDKFSSILTKAIQEQQAIIESQATEIEQLKQLITELSNRLQILENN